MAIQYFEGFENSRISTGMASFGSILGGPAFPAGRMAGIACKITANGSGSGQGFTIPVPTAVSALTFGTAFNMDTTIANNALIQFREGSTVHVQAWYNSSGRMEIRQGNGTILATASSAPALTGLWNYLELKASVADSGGSATLYINGASVATASSVDTRNGGTAGLIDNVLIQYVPSAGGQSAYWDDMVMLDTTGSAPYNDRLGDIRIDVLRPTADGASSQWVGSDGNSVNNWDLVDDVSTTSDYNGSATIGNRDLYNVADLPSSIANVFATKIEGLCAKSDAGTAPGPVKEVNRSTGGTVTTGTLAAVASLTTSYQWFTGAVNQVDPNADPWTVARVNGLQIGVEIG